MKVFIVAFVYSQNRDVITALKNNEKSISSDIYCQSDELQLSKGTEIQMTL